jgi:DNA repair protein RadC
MTINTENQAIINKAISIIESEYKTSDLLVNSPDAVKDFCRLEIGGLEHEVFGVWFLDNKHRLIEFRKMFRGTINVASIYPREVIKEALELNAAALILTHNHPSGETHHSNSDMVITNKIVECCSMFDIRVLDHIIVSKLHTSSFAEKGLM